MNSNRIEEFCRRSISDVAKTKREELEHCVKNLNADSRNQRREIAELKREVAKKNRIISNHNKPRDIVGFDCRGVKRAGK